MFHCLCPTGHMSTKFRRNPATRLPKLTSWPTNNQPKPSTAVCAISLLYVGEAHKNEQYLSLSAKTRVHLQHLFQTFVLNKLWAMCQGPCHLLCNDGRTWSWLLALSLQCCQVCCHWQFILRRFRHFLINTDVTMTPSVLYAYGKICSCQNRK